MTLTHYRRYINITLVFLLGMLCFNLDTAKAQQYFSINKNHKRATIHFRMLRDMMIVQMRINDKGPFNFVLDSGVGIMIITDPKLIDSLNIVHKRLIKISGLGNNENFDAYVTSSLKATMPGISCDDISAAIFTTDHFGLSNYAGIRISGLIGFEFFNSFAVKVNFDDTTITVGAPKDIRIFRNASKLSLSVEDRKPYVTTNVTLADGKLVSSKLIVDLGAGHPISLDNMMDKDGNPPGKAIRSNLGVGLTGPINGFLSRINQVDLGQYKLKSVIASFPEYNARSSDTNIVRRDGNLGLGILKRFNLVVDYQSGLMYLKSNSLFRKPFERDMSGLEYYGGGDNLKHVIIARVEAGSACDVAGIIKGDEIVGINLKSVQEMTMEQIDNILKSGNNRDVLLEIYRDGAYDRIIITLKRRI